MASIDYKVLEEERASEVQQEFETQLMTETSQMVGGSMDSLKSAVLGPVVGGDYGLGVSELKRFVRLKSDYPDFRSKVERYILHCEDLISAIETKRNFPGFSSLSLSKQQELFERVLEHFDELKRYLEKIETVERDVRLADSRSTVMVMKSIIYVTAAVFAVAFLQDMVSGTFRSFDIVFDDFVARILSTIFG